MDLKDLVNKYPGYFIVNYDNYEVIYSEGYKNENGLWCYKISDLYKKPEEPLQILKKQEEIESTENAPTEESVTNENVQEGTEGQQQEENNQENTDNQNAQ